MNEKIMEIKKLQLITQDLPTVSHVEQAELACKGGVRWVQYRTKRTDQEAIKAEALAVQQVCRRHNAVFLVNDFVHLAKAINADGVHVGKSDMPAIEARVILGEHKIIGGTTNTVDDIWPIAPYVNYVGFGPFQFTTTKKKLSPVVGLQGYEAVIEELQVAGFMNTPVIAIGGIKLEDVQPILRTGVHGIAVASMVNQSDDPQLAAASLTKEIQQYVDYSR